ncbi:hypothetical protein [Spirosoma aerophilum]
MNRVFLTKSPFLKAYQTALEQFRETINTAVFIELQHGLLIQRGLAMPISRAEYNRPRKRLDNNIVLNSDGVSEQALGVARRWPDTGVGDAYTIGTVLAFDERIFTCLTLALN